MIQRGKINIGDTDENADWILGPLNSDRRKEEISIHERLVKRVNELKAWFNKFGKRVRE